MVLTEIAVYKSLRLKSHGNCTRPKEEGSIGSLYLSDITLIDDDLKMHFRDGYWRDSHSTIIHFMQGFLIIEVEVTGECSRRPCLRAELPSVRAQAVSEPDSSRDPAGIMLFPPRGLPPRPVACSASRARRHFYNSHRMVG